MNKLIGSRGVSFQALVDTKDFLLHSLHPIDTKVLRGEYYKTPHLRNLGLTARPNYCLLNDGKKAFHLFVSRKPFVCVDVKRDDNIKIIKSVPTGTCDLCYGVIKL